MRKAFDPFRRGSESWTLAEAIREEVLLSAVASGFVQTGLQGTLSPVRDQPERETAASARTRSPIPGGRPSER